LATAHAQSSLGGKLSRHQVDGFCNGSGSKRDGDTAVEQRGDLDDVSQQVARVRRHEGKRVAVNIESVSEGKLSVRSVDQFLQQAAHVLRRAVGT
jgi:hypothetical protein